MDSYQDQDDSLFDQEDIEEIEILDVNLSEEKIEYEEKEIDVEEVPEIEGLSDNYWEVIVESIKNRNNNLLVAALDYVKMDMEKQVGTVNDFYTLLNHCKEIDNDIALAFIILRYNELFGENEPITSWVFTLPHAEDDILEYLIQVAELQFKDCAIGLSQISDEPKLSGGLEKISQVFPRQSVEVYRDVLDTIIKNNTILADVYDDWIRVSSIYQIETSKKPKYLIKKTPLLTHEELVNSLSVDEDVSLTVEQVAAIRMQHLFSSGVITREEIPQKDAEELVTLKAMPKEELNNIIAAYSKYARESSLETNDEIFKILGPSFPFYRERELSSEKEAHPCSRFGGCRMMLCVEFEDEEDEENNRELNPHLVTWFTGSCDQCFLKIAEKHYAVRMPLMYGGWRGCYCSWKCVKDDAKHLVTDTSLKLCHSFEKAFDDIGIYDRIWPKYVSGTTDAEFTHVGKELLDFIQSQ